MKYLLVPIQKWLFYPRSVLCENFYPRNINYMAVVKFFARLDLDQNSSFLDGHLLRGMAAFSFFLFFFTPVLPGYAQDLDDILSGFDSGPAEQKEPAPDVVDDLLSGFDEPSADKTGRAEGKEKSLPDWLERGAVSALFHRLILPMKPLLRMRLIFGVFPCCKASFPWRAK